MTFSIGKRLQSLEQGSAKDIEMRFELLVAALQRRGHSGQLRDDSRLCYKWAIGESTMSADQVAEEVIRMQHLYEETNYASVAATVVSIITKDLISMHGIEPLQAQIWAKRFMVPAVKALFI